MIFIGVLIGDEPQGINFHESVKFIYRNEEIYIVKCNLHLDFSKSTTLKIYTLTVNPIAAVLFLL